MEHLISPLAVWRRFQQEQLLRTVPSRVEKKGRILAAYTGSPFLKNASIRRVRGGVGGRQAVTNSHSGNYFNAVGSIASMRQKVRMLPDICQTAWGVEI